MRIPFKQNVNNQFQQHVLNNHLMARVIHIWTTISVIYTKEYNFSKDLVNLKRSQHSNNNKRNRVFSRQICQCVEFRSAQIPVGRKRGGGGAPRRKLATSSLFVSRAFYDSIVLSSSQNWSYGWSIKVFIFSLPRNDSHWNILTVHQLIHVANLINTE